MAAAMAVAAFAVSAARGITVDPIDPVAEERALQRSLRRHPRLRRFLAQRVDRRSAGGLLLTVAFAIVFGVAMVLGVLLDMVDRDSGLADADRWVSEWGARNAESTSVSVLEWITHLGSTIVVLAALGGAAIIDYAARRNREVFAFVAAVGAGVWLLNNGLKMIVDRDRPDVARLVSAAGSSFPSGHSAAAAAGWAAIALIAGRGRSRRVRAVLAGAAVLIAVAVAASRALLGVHWVSDVVAGAVVGWGWFTLVAVAFGGRRQRLGQPIEDAGRSSRHPSAAQRTGATSGARR